MKPITVNNITYTSVVAAWRALSPEGLKLVTVRWRLREGWNNEDAFTIGTVPPQDRRNFKTIREVAPEV